MYQALILLYTHFLLSYTYCTVLYYLYLEIELRALKEEFQHHQEKIDEYFALIKSATPKEGEGEQSK